MFTTNFLFNKAYINVQTVDLSPPVKVSVCGLCTEAGENFRTRSSLAHAQTQTHFL